MILSLVLVFNAFTDTGKAQEIGSPAPDFSFEQLDGGIFTLSEHEGKLVVIFVIGYNCSLCYASGPKVQENLVEPYKDYEDYVVIGLDVWDGSPGALESFKSKAKVDMPLLLYGSSFATDYNTIRDRLIVIDKDGKLLHRAESSAIGDYANVVPIVDAKLGVASSVENIATGNLSFRVFPNPVVGHNLNLSFTLQKSSRVDAKITSTDGRIIFQNVSGIYSQGLNNITAAIGGLPSGVYIATLTVDGKRTHRKILVD